MKIIAACIFIALSLTGLVVLSIGSFDISPYLLALAGCGGFLLLYQSYAGEKTLIGATDAVPVAGTLLCLAALNWSGGRASSLAYSFMFLLGYVIWVNARARLTRDDVASLFRIIVFAYFVNVALAQFCQMTGWHNAMLDSFLQWQVDFRSDQVRYFGFSSEPSYAAFIVVVSFFGALRLRQAAGKGIPYITAAATIYLVYSFGSIYGYLLALAVLYTECYRRWRLWTVVATGSLAVVAVAFNLESLMSDSTRVGRILQALLSGDIAGLGMADSSTALRVFPTYDYVTKLSITDWHAWLGHGAGTSATYIKDQYLLFNPEGKADLLRLAFFPAFLYDYGLVGAGVIIWFVKQQIVSRLFSFSGLIALLLLFNANFNSQLFWFVLISLGNVKYYCETHLSAGMIPTRRRAQPSGQTRLVQSST